MGVYLSLGKSIHNFDKEKAITYDLIFYKYS